MVNKINKGEHGKINLNKYSSDWQDLIDSLLQTDPKNRPNIEEVYNKVNELKEKISKTNNNTNKKNSTKMDDMFRNCKNLKKIYLINDSNFDLLKNQLEKDNINAELIIK